MATIKVELEINADVGRVWDVISDIDNEPRFWKGTKEVRNISKEGDIISREITIAFRDQKCMQTVKIIPKERIEAAFVKGVINGTKIITLAPSEGGTTMSTVWDIKMTGMLGMFTGMLKSHIKSGTEQAMQSIKTEIER